MLKILRIMEDDYGCEELPEDAELMCQVLVQDESGAETWLRIPDRFLTEQHLQEGSSFVCPPKLYK